MTMTVSAALPEVTDLPQPRLIARALGKRYFGRDAVRGFSIELTAGRVHGIYGGAGSGKTTLAHMLTGALAPDDGEVLCGGRLLDRFAARRGGVVGSGSGLGLLPGRSVAANIYLGHERHRDGRLDLAAMADDASAVLHAIGASEVAALDRLASLGAADRSLVECARVLASRSQVFVLDEPGRELTAREVDRVHVAIRVLADSGVAVLVLSANLAELVEHCDEVALL